MRVTMPRAHRCAAAPSGTRPPSSCPHCPARPRPRRQCLPHTCDTRRSPWGGSEAGSLERLRDETRGSKVGKHPQKKISYPQKIQTPPDPIKKSAKVGTHLSLPSKQNTNKSTAHVSELQTSFEERGQFHLLLCIGTTSTGMGHSCRRCGSQQKGTLNKS